LLFDVAMAPWRGLTGAAERVLGAFSSLEPAVPSRLLVTIGKMPEGVPPAALAAEPALPAPRDWPFGEQFPRTCGTGRVAGGAIFWTDFLYDDHGATGVPVNVLHEGLATPAGSYTYPEGPAAGNGADIFRAAIGLTNTHSWWRVDWNTLVDSAVPIALFALATGRGSGSGEWPAGAGVRSAGIDHALLVSGKGAWLIDLGSGGWTSLEHTVDVEARCFLARVPRSIIEPAGTWTVRLAAGLATDTGDGFASVGPEHGALTGQPAVYNVAFRTHEQEPAHAGAWPEGANYWADKAQAAALSQGDVSEFSLAVDWAQLAGGTSDPEPLITGPSTRWYVSSHEFGQGVAEGNILSTSPQFLGRVQPYSICLPSTYAPGRALPLTLLLHSLAMGQNQFASIDPRMLEEVCEGRDSIVITPLARGPACWYFDEGELDVWEVWARVADEFAVDPDRTVIVGYSMGGYAAYKLGLSYPEVFAKAVSLAGPPTCGVRLLPEVDIPGNVDPDSHCGREGDTWPLLGNARWLPFVVAHGGLDGLVPPLSVAEQVLELDRLGYRYRFTFYPAEDHLAFALQDKFEDAVRHMGTGLRQPDPGHITFAWYPALVRPDLGIGPHTVWWLSELQAAGDPGVLRGRLAEVDARSYALPDRNHTTHRRGEIVWQFDPTPGAVAEQVWHEGSLPARQPTITLRLRGVTSLTVDLARAGFAVHEQGSISVATDNPVTITFRGQGTNMVFDLEDGVTTGHLIAVPEGRHRITFAPAPARRGSRRTQRRKSAPRSSPVSRQREA
jgi:pimeloyl-ACP methyl ester carboxylesterase